ncbi:MAG TPA: hypothetical protein VNT26_22040 [Candidatus Sulfotelmatobacter sp.]|nr:hypothetical protein [Candidatus Sulfotelmatobacter sp.]
MIAAELLKVLCCPETHQEVRLAEPPLLDRLNQQIAAGGLKNRAGQPLKEKLEGGLVRADGKLLFPIQQGIPVMLTEEAIELELRTPNSELRNKSE